MVWDPVLLHIVAMAVVHQRGTPEVPAERQLGQDLVQKRQRGEEALAQRLLRGEHRVLEHRLGLPQEVVLLRGGIEMAAEHPRGGTILPKLLVLLLGMILQRSQHLVFGMRLLLGYFLLLPWLTFRPSLQKLRLTHRPTSIPVTIRRQRLEFRVRQLLVTQEHIMLAHLVQMLPVHQDTPQLVHNHIVH